MIFNENLNLIITITIVAAIICIILLLLCGVYYFLEAIHPEWFYEYYIISESDDEIIDESPQFKEDKGIKNETEKQLTKRG